jgi:hypothetical protein
MMPFRGRVTPPSDVAHGEYPIANVRRVESDSDLSYFPRKVCQRSEVDVIVVIREGRDLRPRSSQTVALRKENNGWVVVNC